jgi:hypothetical protein
MTNGHVIWNFEGEQRPVKWAPNAELRFSKTPDEMNISKVTLNTWRRRPWANEKPAAPGWIVFLGDGKTPYFYQIGLGTQRCGGLANEGTPPASEDWPPEAVVSRLLPDAKRLGKLLGQ